jgi:hypothetical protein
MFLKKNKMSISLISQTNCMQAKDIHSREPNHKYIYTGTTHIIHKTKSLKKNWKRNYRGELIEWWFNL